MFIKSKFFRILISAFTLAGFLTVTGCNKEETKPGIDTSLPGTEEIYYDETNSSSSTISVIWTADEAISAGAKSFTIQLTKSLSKGGDVYDSGTSKTFSITDGAINDAVIFSGLEEGDRYYVRGRANYSGSIMSDWTYICKPDSAGTPAVIMVGTGLYDGPISTVTDVTSKLIRATSSTLTFAFSSTDFKDIATDISRTYDIQLYKDDKCSDLLVSWQLTPSSGMNWGSSDDAGARFIFSGLDPGTTYYLKVVDKTDSDYLTSETLEAKTTDSYVKTITSSTAAAGDVILYEDFSQLIWGGSLLDDENAAGYSATNRGIATTLTPAIGNNPVGDAIFGYYICKVGQNMGLFNTLNKSVGSTRLADWGYLNENAAAKALCCLAGHLQLGASSLCAEIVTPELTCLSGTATIEVSFDAQTESDDLRHAIIEVLNNSTVSNYAVSVSAADRIAAKQFEVDEAHTMRTYTFDIPNVGPASRIAIGGDVSFRTSGQERVFLDNLQIKVKSYGSTEISISTPSITLAAGSDNITASWDACTNASAYVVEYKKSTDADWTVAGTTADTEYKIEGLTAATSYDVRVKGQSGESYSDYSETKTISTSEAPKTVSQKSVFVNATQIGVTWSISDFANVADDQADAYTIAIYKNEACTDLQVKWVILLASKIMWSKFMDISPRFQFPGLNPSTDYWIKIDDDTKSISSTAKYTTTASKVVDLAKLASGSAKAGDTILYEDFGEFVWGGSSADLAAGYTSGNRTTLTSITNATGADPASDDTYKFALTTPSTHMGLYNTLANSVGTTRLANWADWVETDAHKAMCIQSGNLKIGASSLTGDIITPELKALGGTATIKVTFKAAPYKETSFDPFTARVDVFDGAAVSGNSLPIATVPSQTQKFNMEENYGWKTYSFTIAGVKPTDVIGIGCDRNNVTGQHRMYLDDIDIQVVSYE
ncbi:MAG: fibronectin type III domain-containing protein [Bacteroidales bacterium]|jgi:hypothetical protein|nr:fibronectin type III domain-containing protein [Bacteroidales bacterium]